MTSDLPIVGIGASAGGVEALEQFFRAVPADHGMAFVVVTHLSPSHESMLAEILGRAVECGSSTPRMVRWFNHNKFTSCRPVRP
jgi:chemotaxis response regulator CheB